ncbi:UDP-N-acetylmuramate:L-alanyl-gamma-D-glutamyl-meso-diaminopimelate ligase [Orbaceae bacterium ESL0721]|nr:UDP-N-acetylmuramate:L-alanyl-gamma-D-glutamyl-meso-diaminopimelate ligase [Orbaceae bacterium ESL0721]
MHIHILGICGTFMAGIALIARSLGHKVTGSDKNVYPPMSTLLQKEHIDLIEGYDPSQLTPTPDLVIIGNAMSRGNPCVEAILDNNIPYTSAPQWLHDNVLSNRWVIAVAGTHGKTTTAGMVNWILEEQGYQQGFVIGGVPGNFEVSARLGDGHFFVIEADEYDCAFFDKRSKFMHYCPRTLVLNNLEFDHADIFDDLAAIQKQFQYLVRLVPSKGLIISPQEDANLKQVLAKGCWSEQTFIDSIEGWQAKKVTNDASQFKVYLHDQEVGEVEYSLVGEHNMHNALMAIAAAYNVGIEPKDACCALGSFINAKRRLELYYDVTYDEKHGDLGNIQIYDDFAHHPTAILATLEALRSKIGANRRILAVLEPRSNTMKLGVLKDELAPALGRADEVFLYQPENLLWLVADVAEACIQPAYWSGDLDLLAEMVVKAVKPNDVILVMSNGSFGGIHHKILDALNKHAEQTESSQLID